MSVHFLIVFNCEDDVNSIQEVFLHRTAFCLLALLVGGGAGAGVQVLLEQVFNLYKSSGPEVLHCTAHKMFECLY